MIPNLKIKYPLLGKDFEFYKEELKDILTKEEFMLLEAYLNGVNIAQAVKGSGLVTRFLPLTWMYIGKKLLYYNILSHIEEPVMSSEEYKRGRNDLRAEIMGQLKYLIKTSSAKETYAKTNKNRKSK